MFQEAPPFEVQIRNLEIYSHPAGPEISFDIQRQRTQSREGGVGWLTLRLEGGQLRIVSETLMLSAVLSKQEMEKLRPRSGPIG